MWYYSVVRFVIGLLFLSIASIKDLKSRRVPNELWIVMGSIAMVILFVELWMKDIRWEHFLIFVPIGILFSETFVERPPIYSEGRLNFLVLGWLMLPAVVFIYMLNVLSGSWLFWSLAMIPAIMLFAFGMYFFYIIQGGADAKAIITLAVLLPFYPEIPRLTHNAVPSSQIPLMQAFFPFTLVILLNSSLVVIVLPLSYFFVNLSKGDIDLPKMFFGYKKRVYEIEDSFVWPMQYYEDGKLKTELFPRTGTDEKLKSLRKHDRELVWTTPKLPFIVPMLIGFVLSFLIGNPLMYLMA
ncbi:MAG: hypothetical protein KGY76_03975 [Candidatus Thermoplasmatota archaeon]|nr:hypothetical protein [Candidatus Thermoplasmatota archaeon]